MRTTACVLLLVILAATEVLSEPLDIVIGPAPPAATAGQSIVLPIYYHNTSQQTVSVALPLELECRLITEQESIALVAQNVEKGPPEAQAIPAGGFLKTHYAIQLPIGVFGNSRLLIPNLNGASTYFPIAKASGTSQDQFAWTPKTSDQPLDELIQLYQPYVKNISFYEPIYFLVGTQPEYSKFQISLRYRFFNPEKDFVRAQRWLQGFHFGYTQTSFWDLSSDSAPFEDTSYKPELFYISERLRSDGLLNGWFLKAGLRHESNGRGGDLSRSTNIAYIEPILAFYNARKQTGLKITPRIWSYFKNEDENNADLDRYRGHFDLGFTIGKADRWVLDTHVGWAAEGGSVQVDLTYPLHRLFFNPLDIYLQAQYVNRLAESLLDYKERTEAVRIGFSIVR